MCLCCCKCLISSQWLPSDPAQKKRISKEPNEKLPENHESRKVVFKQPDQFWASSGPAVFLSYQWLLMLVPLKGGRSVAYNPPRGSIDHLYTTYILPFYIPLIVLAEPGGWKMLPIPPNLGEPASQPLILGSGLRWFTGKILDITFRLGFLVGGKKNHTRLEDSGTYIYRKKEL